MILTYRDLSQRWSTNEATLRKRLERGQLPEPDMRVGNSPAWNESTIQQWEDNGGTNGTAETG